MNYQKYRYNDCKHYFTINLGFEKRHATPQVITSAMQLYFTDEPLRNVQKFLRLQVSISAICQSSDGARNFHNAYRKEFFTPKNPRTKYIQQIRLQGDKDNNKMERMNEEVRDREKTMRGLKKIDTSILRGYQIFHNYIRQHQGLNNMTPAEASGIKIESKNKWETLIQNASYRLNDYPDMIGRGE